MFTCVNARQLRDKLVGSPHFKAPKIPHTAFVVQHYAGEVLYTTDGFVDSNRDLLQPALIDLMMSSSSNFVQELFSHAVMPQFETNGAQTPAYGAGSHSQHKGGRLGPGSAAPRRAGAADSFRDRGDRGGPSGRSTIIFTSVTAQFRNQLGALVTAITNTSPHFVRCINPNAERSAEDFDTMACLEQLRCGGVMDAVHVTRSGFGSRYLYPDFISRFHCCAPKVADECKGSNREIAAALIRAMGMQEQMFRLGASKIFLKHHIIEMLEVRRSELLREYVVRLQSVWRQHASKAILTKLLLELNARRGLYPSSARVLFGVDCASCLSCCPLPRLAPTPAAAAAMLRPAHHSGPETSYTHGTCNGAAAQRPCKPCWSACCPRRCSAGELLCSSPKSAAWVMAIEWLPVNPAQHPPMNDALARDP